MKRIHSSLYALPGSKFVSAMRQSFTLTLLFSLLLAAGLFCSTAVRAQEGPILAPVVRINPTAGPPTTTVMVQGNGFDPYAAVDIYFDLTDVALAVTNGGGSFGGGALQGGIPVPVPKDAVSGTHWITAVERYGIKAAQTQFLVRVDWAQYRYDAGHSGYNPYEVLLSPETVSWLQLGWWKWGLGYVESPSVAVANGILYVASVDGWWYAFDAVTGKSVWGRPFFLMTCSGIAAANGLVYAQETAGGAFALNAATGAIVWQGPNFGFCNTPTVANGLVYVGSWDGNQHALNALYALNAKTGATVWTFPTGARVQSTPAVANGVVYFGSDDGHLYAVTAGTGTLLWTFPASGEVTVSKGTVYLGADKLYALNAATGQILWTSPYTGTPTIANGVLYLVGLGINALDASTGALLWQYTMQWQLYSPPAVANGVVYFTFLYPPSFFLYALDASTGALLWEKGGGETNFWISEPVVVNGFVYFTEGAELYAFDLPASLSPDRLSPPERPDPALLTPTGRSSRARS